MERKRELLAEKVSKGILRVLFARGSLSRKRKEKRQSKTGTLKRMAPDLQNKKKDSRLFSESPDVAKTEIDEEELDSLVI